MIKREIIICCEEFEKNKHLFRTILSSPFSLQGIMILPLSEKEIKISYCPFCGREFPAFRDEEN